MKTFVRQKGKKKLQKKTTKKHGKNGYNSTGPYKALNM